MNAEMDISKSQWRSTGGMPGFLLGSVDYNSNKCVFTTIYRSKVFIIKKLRSLILDTFKAAKILKTSLIWRKFIIFCNLFDTQISASLAKNYFVTREVTKFAPL